MPGNKKTRKPMKVKPVKALTVMWKQKEGDYLRMALTPYQFLDKIFNNEGTEDDAIDLHVRTSWGIEALSFYFEPGIEGLSEMKEAQAMSMTLINRAKEFGKPSCTQEERDIIHRGLTIADEVHKKCTRKENLHALKLAMKKEGIKIK